GGRAKDGISQFGSTFRLCFSAITGISQGHGNVFASAELRHVYMTQQPGTGTIRDNIEPAAAGSNRGFQDDHDATAYRSSHGRISLSTGSFGTDSDAGLGGPAQRSYGRSLPGHQHDIG